MAVKISVIVPVYKAEKYLHRCVDSILAQSYTDFELLLIDDGTPDNSGTICDEYAAKDSRVRVFHKPNGGVSSARNLGLDNARGEWYTFVDADDWVEQEYLENFVTVDAADMIVCAVKASDGYIWNTDNHLYTLKEFFAKYSDTLIIRSCWATFFRASIISEHNIRFDTLMRYGEDMIFNLHYLLYCFNIRTINLIGYNYFQDGNVHSKKYLLSFDEIYYSLIKSINIKNQLKTYVGIHFNLDADFGSYLSMCPIVLMTEKNYFDEYYNLCNKFDLTLSLESFYNHRLFSPIIRGISELKSKYAKKDFKEWDTYYRALQSISSQCGWKLTFQFKDFYFWNWLIKHDFKGFLNFSLKAYFIFKHVLKKCGRTSIKSCL